MKNDIEKLSTYSTTPQQVGAWIDGTPVWRMAFEISFREEFSKYPEDYAVTLDDGYYSFSIPIKEFNETTRILALNAIQTPDVNFPSFIDDVVLERDWNEGGILRVKLHLSTLPSTYEKLDGEGIYGYIEFVTPASNIRS